MQTKAVVVALFALIGLVATSSPVAAEPAPTLGVTLPVIEVLDPSGVMTAPFVRTAVMKVEPALLKCAEASKWRSDALVWIVTDWRGKVTKLELAVDSASIEKCFAKALKSIVVTKTQVRATTFVKLRVGVPANVDDTSLVGE